MPQDLPQVLAMPMHQAAQISRARSAMSNKGLQFQERLNKIQAEEEKIHEKDYQDVFQRTVAGARQDLVTQLSRLPEGGLPQGTDIDHRGLLFASLRDEQPANFEAYLTYDNLFGRPHALDPIDDHARRARLVLVAENAIPLLKTNLGKKYKNWLRETKRLYKRYESLADEHLNLAPSLNKQLCRIRIARKFCVQNENARPSRLLALEKNGQIAHIRQLTKAPDTTLDGLKLKHLNPARDIFSVAPANKRIDAINTSLEEYRRVQKLIELGCNTRRQFNYRNYLSKEIQANLNDLNLYLNECFAQYKLESLILPANETLHPDQGNEFINTLKTLNTFFKPTTGTDLAPITVNLSDTEGSCYYYVDDPNHRDSNNHPKLKKVSIHGGTPQDYMKALIQLAREECFPHSTDEQIMDTMRNNPKALKRILAFGLFSPDRFHPISYYKKSGNLKNIRFSSSDYTQRWAKMVMQNIKDRKATESKEQELTGQASATNPTHTASFSAGPPTGSMLNPPAPPATLSSSSTSRGSRQSWQEQKRPQQSVFRPTIRADNRSPAGSDSGTDTQTGDNAQPHGLTQ